MKMMMQRFGMDESGAALAEYAILLALIAVVSITAIGVVGNDVNNAFVKIKNAI